MNEKNENVRTRIKNFVDSQGITQRDFFEKTGLSRGLLDTDKLNKDVGADKITNILVAFPELSSDWLMTGLGKMIKTKTANNLTDENSKENGKDFGSKPNMQKNLPYIIEGGDIAEMASDWNEHKKYSRETIKNLQRPDSPNLDRSKGLQVNPYILRTDRRKEMQVIPIYNMEASAGLVHLLDNPNSQNPIDYISIPNLPNCDGALFVTGDSMYPLLKSGDIVAYKNVQDIKNDIFWGEMYLVSLDMSGEELVTIKYVQKSEKAGHIKLVSQNKHHQDKEVRLSKIRALALIKASIRYNLLY